MKFLLLKSTKDLAKTSKALAMKILILHVGDTILDLAVSNSITIPSLELYVNMKGLVGQV